MSENVMSPWPVRPERDRGHRAAAKRARQHEIKEENTFSFLNEISYDSCTMIDGINYNKWWIKTNGVP